MSQKAYELFFGTLANTNRLKIINILRKQPLSVTEICKKTKLNQTTTSHSLKRLQTCGFVKVVPKGKERIYHLNTTTIKPLMKLIDTHMNAYCKRIIQNERTNH